MKKLIFCAIFLFSSGLVACGVDTMECEDELFSLRAVIEEQTRTSLGETTANGYKTTWMAGDAIGLFSDTNPTVNRMLVTYQSAPSVTFSGAGAVDGNEYFAYYPYSPDVTFSDGVFSLELPSEQRYTDDDHLLEYVPMVARNLTTDQLHFAHCTGLVRLQLLGNATIEDVRLETLDGQSLWGTLQVTTAVNGENINMELVGGGSAVTLCGLSKTLSDRRVTSFLIAVPEGEYHGIRFSIQDSEKNVMNLQASDFTMQVVRSHILSMPPVVYAPTERIYEVGDLYDDGTIRGIVFEVDASGEHGKIVSLDETSGFFGGGRNVLNLTDANDGQVNKTAWRKSPGSSDIMTWACAGDWYLPAQYELAVIHKNRTVVGNSVVAAGGTPFSQVEGSQGSEYAGMYWSSTCGCSPSSSTMMMWCVNFLDDTFMYSNTAASNVKAHARRVAVF